jgi:hypothetical protein
LIKPHTFAPLVHAVPKFTGGLGQAHVAGGAGFAGAIALQTPPHVIVPVFVWPHAFAGPVQAFPYPIGFAGVDALQDPSHLFVPVFTEPQAFAELVHAVPYPFGLAGAPALQLPSHWVDPPWV